MVYTENADNTITPACEWESIWMYINRNGLESDYSETHRHQVKLRQEENSCFAEHFIVRLKVV